MKRQVGLVSSLALSLGSPVAAQQPTVMLCDPVNSVQCQETPTTPPPPPGETRCSVLVIRCGEHAPTPCPKGTTVADGCNSVSALMPPGLPTSAYDGGAGTVQYATFFTCTDATNGCGPQSGQIFSNQPRFNVAGVDYPVGPAVTIDKACDPAAPSGACMLPVGCTYAHGNGANLPDSINCEKATDIKLAGWNFRPTATHGCVFVAIQKTALGTVDIHDNYFETDPLCTLYSVSYPGLIYISAGDGVRYHIYKNQFEGHNNSTDSPCVGTPGCISNTSTTGRGQPAVSSTTSGKPAEFVFVFNDVEDMQGHALDPASGGAAYFVGYNFVASWNPQVASGHGEMVGFQGPGIQWEDIEHNTILAPWTMCACGTTVIYPAATDGGSIGYEIINGNIIVAGNKVGGSNVQNATYQVAIDDGAGTGAQPGNVLTVLNDPADNGPTFGMLGTIGSSNYEITAHAGGPASGKGSKWLVSQSTGGKYWYPPYVSVAIAPTSFSVGTGIAFYEGSTFNHGAITGSNPVNGKSITITNNYVDFTRSNAYGLWATNYAGGTSSCAAGSEISGNQDLTTTTPNAAVNAYLTYGGNNTNGARGC